jgi:ribosomal protein RSM22 (predicted rRNA methylase)
MNLESLDWEVLDRLRQTFLSEARTEGPYWHTITDLQCYDRTFGERIGWKWDAVLRELRARRWSPAPGGTLLDWGCGSGVAGRRVAEFFGSANFSRMILHDHSALAIDYAEQVARTAFPELPVERASVRFLREPDPIDVLVISHVLNELDEKGRAELGELLGRAQTVLWVEPGTHEVSRALIGWREQLRQQGFHAVAPCTHAAACGLLVAGNERHWCHHFAEPPTGIHADSDWVRFAQRAGIDLRALPYSFLVLDCRSVNQPADTSRILGDPQMYKGYARIFNCSAEGVEELTLQQRDDKPLFKSLKHARGPLLYRWTRAGERITAAEPVLTGFPKDGTA